MLNTPLRMLSMAMLSTVFVGCGGGGDSSSTKKAPSEPQNVDTVVEEVLVEPETIIEDNNPVPSDGVNDDVITDAPVTTSEELVFKRLNKRRVDCGFGALRVSQRLTDMATNHGQYLLYASENSDSPFSGHAETRQPANPYFSGEGLAQRINTRASTIGNKAVPVSYQYRILTESLSYNVYPDAYLDANSDNDIALGGINGLLSAPYHLADLVSPDFNQVGIYYGRGKVRKALHQGSVLEMVLGRPLTEDFVKQDKVLSYPCSGTKDTAYELTNETPNPFWDAATNTATRDLNAYPIGQPIYILGNGNITVSDYTLKDAANTLIELKMLTSDKDKKHADPHGKLKDNQVFLIPLSPLKPNTMYQVNYKVSVDGSIKQDKEIKFKTKVKS